MISLIGKQMLKWAVVIGLCVFLWALFSPAQAAEAAAPVSTLQTSLVEIIQQVQTGVSAGVNFLQAEIPDVLRQLLVWKMVEAIVLGVLFFLLALIIIPTIRWARKYHEDYETYDFPGHFVLSAFVTAVSFVSMTASVKYGLVALQIWVAPKVYLIEYAASLVK